MNGGTRIEHGVGREGMDGGYIDEEAVVERRGCWVGRVEKEIKQVVEIR